MMPDGRSKALADQHFTVIKLAEFQAACSCNFAEAYIHRHFKAERHLSIPRILWRMCGAGGVSAGKDSTYVLFATYTRVIVPEQQLPVAQRSFFVSVKTTHDASNRAIEWGDGEADEADDEDGGEDQGVVGDGALDEDETRVTCDLISFLCASPAGKFYRTSIENCGDGTFCAVMHHGAVGEPGSFFRSPRPTKRAAIQFLDKKLREKRGKRKGYVDRALYRLAIGAAQVAAASSAPVMSTPTPPPTAPPTPPPTLPPTSPSTSPTAPPPTPLPLSPMPRSEPSPLRSDMFAIGHELLSIELAETVHAAHLKACVIVATPALVAICLILSHVHMLLFGLFRQSSPVSLDKSNLMPARLLPLLISLLVLFGTLPFSLFGCLLLVLRSAQLLFYPGSERRFAAFEKLVRLIWLALQWGPTDAMRLMTPAPFLLLIHLLATEAFNLGAMELQRAASTRPTTRPICTQLMLAATSMSLAYSTVQATLTFEGMAFRAIGI